MKTDSHPVPQISGARQWYVLIAVSSGTFLSTIDGSIVNIALPTLEKSLGTNFTTIQWVVLAYLLTIATLMLPVGRLADMFGKKRLYLVGYLIFTSGSVLCGLSSSVELLIAFRILQAIGATFILALGSAIVTEAFPTSERGKALGVIGTMVSIGLISGPTIGGVILGSLSWHWIFFVNLPVGVIGILLVARFVPDTRPGYKERFDLPGAVTLFAALLSLLMAMSIGQTMGFVSPVVLGMIGLAILFVAIFISVERRSAYPMIQLILFENKLFSVNLITGVLTFICSAGAILLMPFYLQNILGLDPSASGLLLSVVPLTMGIVAPISGWLSDRFGTRPLTVIGLAVLLLGYLAASTLNETTSRWLYALCFFPVGVGMGLFNSPNNSAIMGAVPRNRLGVASGLMALTRTVGQTTGVSVIGALWASQVFKMIGATNIEATAAPVEIQVAALHQTILVIVGLIFLALSLSVWALLQERANAKSDRAYQSS